MKDNGRVMDGKLLMLLRVCLYEVRCLAMNLHQVRGLYSTRWIESFWVIDRYSADQW